MHRLLRSAVVAFLLAACGGQSSKQDAGPTVCTTLTDCSGNQVCLNSSCVNICHATSECQTSATPNNVCEEGVCLSPACGSDSQCGGGQSCLGGKCATSQVASQAASCEVTPNPADVRAGSTVQLTALAQDSDGKALHLSSFKWSATNGATITPAGVFSATAAGDSTVTATIGTKACTGVVHAYPAPAANTLRVTVINMHTKEPVAGAKVVIDAAVPLTTGADGTASATVAAGPHDVHVFAVAYNYTSYLQTNSTDLLVPIAPYIPSPQRSGFTSHLCDSKADDPACSAQTEFAPLQDTGEAVHLAFFGSSVPNSLLDLSVDTLVGPMHKVHLTLPGTTTSRDQALPYGLVLGIASNFFGTNDPRVFAEGGVRSLWGIGGNVNLSKVVTILSPLLQPGATIDVGTLLPQLLQFFGRLEAGAVVGVQAPANVAPGGTPTFKTQPIQLTTPMRLRVDATSPKLPKLDGTYLDGVIAVAGAMDYPMGFVPLGLTAGLSAKDGNGNILDPTCDTSGGTAPCATNKLPLKFAPENGGTEGSKIGVALLALNFGGLTPGSSAKVAVSGQVTVMDKVDYVAPGQAAPAITPGDFMKLPASNSVAVARSTHHVTVTGDGDPAVQIYRFELENGARQNWNLWMPPVGSATGTRGFTMPDPGFSTASPCDPMTALCNPWNDAIGDDGLSHGPTARLLALELSSAATTADQLETFSNGTRLDELGPALKAFTALQVDVGN